MALSMRQAASRAASGGPAATSTDGMLSSAETQTMSVDAAIVLAFVLPERRSRHLGFLESKRGRVKFRKHLAHFKDCDPRFTAAIPPGQQTAQGIETLLWQYGAPETCTIISESQDLDGVVMALPDALRKIVGYGAGSIISCLEGRLAYYEGEEPGCRYALRRAGRQP